MSKRVSFLFLAFTTLILAACGDSDANSDSKADSISSVDDSELQARLSEAPCDAPVDVMSYRDYTMSLDCSKRPFFLSLRDASGDVVHREHYVPRLVNNLQDLITRRAFGLVLAHSWYADFKDDQRAEWENTVAGRDLESKVVEMARVLEDAGVSNVEVKTDFDTYFEHLVVSSIKAERYAEQEALKRNVDTQPDLQSLKDYYREPFSGPAPAALRESFDSRLLWSGLTFDMALPEVQLAAFQDRVVNQSMGDILTEMIESVPTTCDEVEVRALLINGPYTDEPICTVDGRPLEYVMRHGYILKPLSALALAAIYEYEPPGADGLAEDAQALVVEAVNTVMLGMGQMQQSIAVEKSVGMDLTPIDLLYADNESNMLDWLLRTQPEYETDRQEALEICLDGLVTQLVESNASFFPAGFDVDRIKLRQAVLGYQDALGRVCEGRSVKRLSEAYLENADPKAVITVPADLPESVTGGSLAPTETDLLRAGPHWRTEAMRETTLNLPSPDSDRFGPLEAQVTVDDQISGAATGIYKVEGTLTHALEEPVKLQVRVVLPAIYEGMVQDRLFSDVQPESLEAGKAGAFSIEMPLVLNDYKIEVTRTDTGESLTVNRQGARDRYKQLFDALNGVKAKHSDLIEGFWLREIKPAGVIPLYHFVQRGEPSTVMMFARPGFLSLKNPEAAAILDEVAAAYTAHTPFGDAQFMPSVSSHVFLKHELMYDVQEPVWIVPQPSDADLDDPHHGHHHGQGHSH